MPQPTTLDESPPTIRTLVGSVVRRPDQITQREQNLVQRLRTVHPRVEAAVALTHAFATMVRQQQPEQLEPWLWRVANSEVAALRRFAAGIQRDKAAVLAALQAPWSQGQVEGQITRLKLIKRTMYGRANFDLLRLRVLNPP